MKKRVFHDFFEKYSWKRGSAERKARQNATTEAKHSMLFKQADFDQNL